MLNTAWQAEESAVIIGLRAGVLRLQQARIASASLDARLLLEHVLGIGYEALLAANDLTFTMEQQACYQALIDKRAARQPMAQLLGTREFWGLCFAVTPDTLDPRPDSETLVEAVLMRSPDVSAPVRILDLGTGTGCLLLALLSEYKAGSGLGIDCSERALQVAQANAQALGLAGRAGWRQSCWLAEVEGQFDIVVANPPYIPTGLIASLMPEVAHYEPHAALDGGADGLCCYRDILAGLPRVLALGGVAAFEIGAGQLEAVEALITGHGLRVAGVKKDLCGITRCILVTH